MPLVPVPLDRHASFLKDTIVNSDRTGTHDTDIYRNVVPIDTIWEMWKYNCVIVTSLDHVRFRLHRVRHREGPVLRPEPVGGEREGGVAGQLHLHLPEVLGVVVADCVRLLIMFRRPG